MHGARTAFKRAYSTIGGFDWQGPIFEWSAITSTDNRPTR
jgi:hypothetical protein